MVCAAALTACGLSVTGQFTGDALPDDDASAPPADATPRADGTTNDEDASGTSDATADVSMLDVDAGAICDSGLSSSVVILPANGVACPSGTSEKTLQTSPVATAGACTCGTCTPMTNPSCNGVNLGVTWGGSNSCGSGNDSYDVTDNICIDWGYGTFSLVAYHAWNARTPTAGSCTAASTPDATKVTTSAFRHCVPTSASAVCEAQASGQKLCIDSGGAACAGAFSKTVVAGDTGSVTCAACACSRTSAKCTVEYHTDSNCTQLRYTTEANGTCTRTNDATNVRYLKVFPSPATCNATPGAATPSLTNAKTFCCMP